MLWSRVGSGYLNIPTCTSVESIDIGSRKQSKPSSHTRECGVIGIGRGIVPCISDHPFILYSFSLGAGGKQTHSTCFPVQNDITTIVLTFDLPGSDQQGLEN